MDRTALTAKRLCVLYCAMNKFMKTVRGMNEAEWFCVIAASVISGICLVDSPSLRVKLLLLAIMVAIAQSFVREMIKP